MRLARVFVVTVVSLLSAAGCWPDILPPGGTPVARVQVSPPTARLQLGETLQFAARVTDRQGRELTDREVSWESSDPASVSVDGTGVATALGATTRPVTITAIAGGAAGSARVTVDAGPPTSLEVRPGSATVGIGETLQFEARVEDAGGTPVPGAAVTWSGSDPTVLEVGADGSVRGLSLGTATVYASLGALRDSALVEVVAPGTVHVCATDGGGALTVPSIAAALETVAPGGEILLCDGRFPTPEDAVEHAVTIGALPGTQPIIEGQLGVEHTEGLVHVRDVTFEDTDPEVYSLGIRAMGLADLLVENALFTGHGVTFGATEPSDATMTVRSSRFIGGTSGVYIFTGTGSIVDNYFEGSTGSSTIQWQGGVNGEVLGNRFLDCGWRGCIRVVNAGTVLIADNYIETNDRRDLFVPTYGTGVIIGIAADGVDVTAERNTIIGLGTPADPAERFTYPMSYGALSTVRSDPGRRTTLRNNVVRGAGVGIGALGVETLIAEGNTIEDVHTVIETAGNPDGSDQRVRAIHGNDFVSYLTPIVVVTLGPTNGPLPDASLTCNWWGSDTGPTGPISIDPSQYTPFATAPIAGTGRAC